MFYGQFFYIPCVMSPLIIGVIFTSILADQGLLNNLLEIWGLSALAVNWLAKYATAMSIGYYDLKDGCGPGLICLSL